MLHTTRLILSFLWPDWLPFIGQLKGCAASDFKEAAVELFWATAASTMPLWFGPLIYPFIFASIDFKDEVIKAIQTGELFIYASAMLGPLLYTLNKDYGSTSTNNKVYTIFRFTLKFPYGSWFILSSFAILLISSSAFYITRNPIASTAIALNAKGITRLSIWVYIGSLFIYFVAACYRNKLDDFEPDEHDTQFANEWVSRRKSLGDTNE